jgi:hypothetical protein
LLFHYLQFTPVKITSWPLFTENLMPDRPEEEKKEQPPEETYEFGFKPQYSCLSSCFTDI